MNDDMTKLRFSGRSIADALQAAGEHFGVRETDLDYQMIQEPKNGFLGFSRKDAVIEAWPKTVPDNSYDEDTAATDALKQALLDAPIFSEKETEAEAEETFSELEMGRSAEELGLAFLGPIFEALKVDPVVTVSQEDDAIRFDVSGDNVGILIGRRGDNLYDLQFLLSLAINRHIDNHLRVILDVENYQQRRMETLEDLAIRLADQARDQRRILRLEPMRANERRIIHLALEKEEGISSKSEGRDPYRRVVIMPEFDD